MIDKDVFVGPLTVIRADQRRPDGKVAPIRIEEEVNIQDGVIVHSGPGAAVTIGARTSVAHGVVIHGPCIVGKECFLAIRSLLYSATLEDHVWVDMKALVMRATLPASRWCPPATSFAGFLTRGGSDWSRTRKGSLWKTYWLQTRVCGWTTWNSGARRNRSNHPPKAQGF